MVISLRLVSVSMAWLLLISTTPGIAANNGPYIDISVDAERVYAGDTIILNVESTGLLDPLDVSVLDNSFEFIRQTTGTRIAVIKGKVSEIAIRRMELTPTTTGPLVIGPLSAGDVTSNSVSVLVLDAIRSEWIPEPDDLRIAVSVSESQTRVHSEVTLEIKLLHRYPLSDEKIQLPELDGFNVRPVYEERRTYTDASQNVRQTAWRYLLFPEQSGETIIDSIAWNGTVIKSRPERAKFERQSQAMTLTILPALTDQQDWWLPAQSVELTESWSKEIKSIQAGDELIRTLNVTASGVQASQIPTPTVLESRAISQTLIGSNREDVIVDNQIQAKADFTYRVKAKSPIPVFLDTIRIAWWNTHTEQAMEAIIPARRINVGLPDRADLLKNIALDTTATSTAVNWLQSANKLRLLGTVMGGVIFMLAAFLFLPKIIHAFQSKRNSRATLAQLRRRINTEDWQALYNELIRLQRQGWGQPSLQVLLNDQTNMKKALALLQPVLFTHSTVSPDKKQLLHLTGTLQPPMTQRRKKHMRTDTSELVQL